ncbi:MAG: hypothetical protein WCE30_28680 [Mycobacterium sp.]
MVELESVEAAGVTAASAAALVALALAAVVAVAGAAAVGAGLVAAVAAVGTLLVLALLCWPVADWPLLAASALAFFVFLLGSCFAGVFDPLLVGPDEAAEPVSPGLDDPAGVDESEPVPVAATGFFGCLWPLLELPAVEVDALPDELFALELPELLDEDEPPSPPFALAIPVPLAMAAPRPSVTAPTPSQL